MKHLKILLPLLFTIYGKTHGQPLQPPRAAYRIQPVTPSFEKRCKGSQRIRNKKTQAVSITFFQDFSDTVSIRVNGRELFRKWIQHDSELVSTNHTGVFFSHVFPEETNAVSIVYIRSGIQLDFPLNRKYPLYAIYNYGNGQYYVSARKCIMIIK